MADFVTINIKGLDKVKARLDALAEKVKRKHLRTIMKEATETLREEAARHAPRRKINSGWEAFVTRPGLSLRDGVAAKVSITQAGASGLVGLDYSKVHHGHLVEFGTRPHLIKIKTKSGKYRVIKHPGSRKQPFMRPAFDNKSSEVAETMINRLIAAVETEAKSGS